MAADIPLRQNLRKGRKKELVLRKKFLESGEKKDGK